jgi:hypothetical protein
VSVGGSPGDFRAKNVARVVSQPNGDPGDLSLKPFYRTHGRTYSVYFDVLSGSEFDARVAELAAEAERQRHLEAVTVAVAQPGDAASERTFNYRSEPADRPVTRTAGRTGRGGAGWFSFDLPITADVALALVITYHNDLGLPVLANFEIQVEGTPIARYAPNRSATSFWSETYALPAALLKGKNNITVRFQAATDSRIATVYGVRVVRV